MIGWLLLILIAIATGVILWLAGFPRRLISFALAAVLLGAAGYAMQGAPGLPAKPVSPELQRGTVDPVLVELRQKMFGRITQQNTYFVASDAMIRRGKPDRAVQVMLSAVRETPNDGSLWTWLGVVMAQHDGNRLSPPAQLAFDQALALWPDHPGPRFYLGVAHLRAGDPIAARRWWAEALELTPEESGYRDEIAERLALLERLLREAGEIDTQ
jgi:cytochrome c-type biogenesis protein CcmH